jgi:hypothetical protein
MMMPLPNCRERRQLLLIFAGGKCSGGMRQATALRQRANNLEGIVLTIIIEQAHSNISHRDAAGNKQAVAPHTLRT